MHGLTGGDWKRAVTCGTAPVPDPPHLLADQGISASRASRARWWYQRERAWWRRRLRPSRAGEVACLLEGPAWRQGARRGRRGHQPGTCLR